MKPKLRKIGDKWYCIGQYSIASGDNAISAYQKVNKLEKKIELFLSDTSKNEQETIQMQ